MFLVTKVKKVATKSKVFIYFRKFNNYYIRKSEFIFTGLINSDFNLKILNLFHSKENLIKFKIIYQRNSNSGLTSSISSGTASNANGLLNANKIFIVHRQPLPLDSCVFCDTESQMDMQIQQQNGGK